MSYGSGGMPPGPGPEYRPRPPRTQNDRMRRSPVRLGVAWLVTGIAALIVGQWLFATLVGLLVDLDLALWNLVRGLFVAAVWYFIVTFTWRWANKRVVIDF